MPSPNVDRAHALAPSAKVMAPASLAGEAEAIASLAAGGRTANFVVRFDPAIYNGQDLATAVLSSCEADLARCSELFGGVMPPGMPFQVDITNGANGASHQTCAATAITVGAQGVRYDPDYVRHFVMAEVVEVFEAALGKGWDCGSSPGEGLSRVLAAEFYPQPPGSQAAPTWLDQTPTGPDDRCPHVVAGAARQDWVNNADQADTCYFSIGCSVLFLNWLRFELNTPWTDIVRAGGATLAETYASLTSKNDAWTSFRQLIDTHFPVGTPSGLTTDNPFPL